MNDLISRAYLFNAMSTLDFPEKAEVFNIIQNAPTQKEEFKQRPDKTTYYTDIAAAVARRSTCLRRQYGAVIVKNDEIIATGYNGSPRGEENCCDVGECWRRRHGIPHGEQYEKCQAVHAEENAIISAARRDMVGATIYLAGWECGEDREPIERMKDPQPCEQCRRRIKNAGLTLAEPLPF